MGLATKIADLQLQAGASFIAPGVSFNGTTSHIRYANDFVGGFTDQLAISFWCKPIGTPSVNFPVIIGSPDGGGDTGEVFITLRKRDSSVCGFFANFEGAGDSGADFSILDAGINIGSWNHIMFAFNGTTAKTLSVNGATKTLTATYNTTDYFPSGSTADTWLGGSETGSGDGVTNEYKGELAEVWVNNSYIDVTNSSVISQFKDSDNKPVKNLPSSQVHLRGNASTWTNLGSKDLGTQTLSNITTAASSPSD